MSNQTQVPIQAVLAKLHERVAADALTIAVLEARVETLEQQGAEQVNSTAQSPTGAPDQETRQVS